jgi:protease-4
MAAMSAAQEGLVRGLTFAVGLVLGALVLIATVAVIVFALSLGLGAGTAAAGRGAPGDGYVHVSGSTGSKNKLLVVRVEGPILGAPPKDNATHFFLGGLTYGYEVQQQLQAAANRSDVKGVLLHLQTPGGTIFGSRAIHDGVMAYRNKTKKPVVAYIEGLSASGGVMAMVGANKIYADHGSLIGSIGVLGPQLVFYNKPIATDGGLLESGMVTQDGIELFVIGAGRSKDIGNPFRRPTEEELATLTRGVEAEYQQFVQHVAKNRKMDPTVIRERMGALIFDNATAQGFGLIDGTLARDEAVRRLAELAGTTRDYQVVRPGGEEGGMLRRLMGVAFGGTAPAAAQSARDILRLELCASVRAPLAYYGDPTIWCK